MEKLDITSIEALAIGGAILGGGGGGSYLEGIKTAQAAFADGHAPQLISLADLAEDDLILTISAVGAPSAKDQFVTPADYQQIIDIFEKNVSGKIKGFITNEMGGGSSFNAFIPSALKGIPMVDAACNGRAHPLGTMGAMGLAETPNYITAQVAVGGNPEKGLRVELWTKGTIQATSSAVRNSAVSAGGLVVVARNMVSKSYIADHAAIGVVTQSYELGQAFLTASTAELKLAAVANYLGGSLLCQGRITALELRMENGLDVGSLKLEDQQDNYELAIWNEYMAAEKDGVRLHTFPDLLMTFDSETALPVTSAELSIGQKITVLAIPYQQLELGAGMFEASGYQAIEEVLKIEMLPYISELIKEKVESS